MSNDKWFYQKSTFLALRWIESLILICLVVGYGWATYQRNFIWKTDLSLWSDVVTKFPDKARPNHNLGRVYQKNDSIDEAILQYQKTITLDPHFPRTHNNLAVCYFRKGRIDDALAEFQRAIYIDPNYAEAHYNLGVAYGSKGQYDLAFREIKMAKELYSEDKWAAIVKGIKDGLLE